MPATQDPQDAVSPPWFLVFAQFLTWFCSLECFSWLKRCFSALLGFGCKAFCVWFLCCVTDLHPQPLLSLLTQSLLSSITEEMLLALSLLCWVFKSSRPVRWRLVYRFDLLCLAIFSLKSKAASPSPLLPTVLWSPGSNEELSRCLSINLHLLWSKNWEKSRDKSFKSQINWVWSQVLLNIAAQGQICHN